MVLALTPVLQCPADDTDFSVLGCSENRAASDFFRGDFLLHKKKRKEGREY